MADFGDWSLRGMLCDDVSHECGRFVEILDLAIRIA